MKDRSDYRRGKAEEAERAAKAAQTAEERRAYKELARQWRTLAADETPQDKPDSKT